MGNYRTFGTGLDRVFRNNLNSNFQDIAADIEAQKTRVNDLITGTPQPSEVVDARGGKAVLKDRLDAVDASLADITTSVKKFGAVGNGVVDDRKSIQDTIDYVASLPNGGTVFIPEGYTFLLNSMTDPTNHNILLLKDKVSIAGKGTFKIANGFGDYNAIFKPSTSLNNVTYKEFTIDDNTTNNPMVNIPAVGTYVNNRTCFHLWGYSMSKITIDGITMKDCVGVWQITTGPINELTIKNSKVYISNTFPNDNYDRTSIYFGGTKGIFTGNYLYGGNFGWTGLEIHGTQTICDHNLFDSYNSAVLIANDAVMSSKMENVTVSNNVITNTRKGITPWFEGTNPVNQIKIHGNNIHIKPDKFNDPTGVTSYLEGFGISFYQYWNSPSVRNVEIMNNSIEFDIPSGVSLDPSGLKYSGIGMINYTTNKTYTLENIKIVDNSIKNSIDSGIHIEVYGATVLNNLLIQDNVIINSGQTSGKSGIRLARIPSYYACKIIGNNITDNRVPMQMGAAIWYLNDSGSANDNALTQLQFIDNDIYISDTNVTNGVNTSASTFFTFSYACYLRTRLNNIGNYTIALPAKVGSIIEDIGTGRIYRQTTSPSGTNWISDSFGSTTPTSGHYLIGSIIRNTSPSVGNNSAWICTSSGNVSTISWNASTSYNVGDQVINSENRIYMCTVAGTSGSTSPTGTGLTITDGTVTWKYLTFTGIIKPFNSVTNVKMGTFTINGDGTNFKTITHNLGATPTNWQVTPVSIDVATAGIKYVTANSTTLVVNFNNVLPAGTNNIVLNWRAEV